MHHDQPLGRGHDCEYSHVWEIQGDNTPYTGITSYKPDSPNSRHKPMDGQTSLTGDLPTVPDITRTDRIYELTLSGKSIPGGNVIAAMNAAEGNSQCTPTNSITGGYSRRPGGPMYFELEAQNEFGSGNCSV